jgi:hypothetical protein
MFGNLMHRIILLNDIGIYDQALPCRYIGPYVLASILENHGYEVFVIDWFTRLIDDIDYIEKFINNKTILIGLSSTLLALPIEYDEPGKLYRSYRSGNYHKGYLWFDTPDKLNQWSFKLKNALNKKNKNAKLILGGAKTPFVWSRSGSNNYQIAYKDFDLITIGAADSLILEIADSIISGKTLNIIEKNSLKFIKSGFFLNEKTCPKTHWSDATCVLPNESLPIEISRGCAFNCKFCNYEKRSANIKDVALLKEELMDNYEKYGTTVYNFSDDCFNDSKNKVYEICNMFLSLPFKIEWITYARIDLAVKFPDTFDIMIKSGCKGVCFGIESLNYEACRRAGKGVPPEKVKKTLKELYEKYQDQCFFQCSFIVGLPFETEESQLETIEWFKNNKSLDFASIGVLGLPNYEENDNDNQLDYADYVKNPQRYGFKKISFDPYYWEHETMNYTDAFRLSKFWNDEVNKDLDAAVLSIWGYPSLRTFGFTFDEIVKIMRSKEEKQYWSNLVSERSQKYLENYHSKLLLKSIK